MKIKTRVIEVDPDNPDLRAIKEAVDLLKQGEVVAFPTETVYGLGADGLNPDAVMKIYQAKKRPPDNPMILHIGDPAMLNELVTELPHKARKLINNFWPGPLTLVLRKKPAVPDIVSAGLDTVGIRMPSGKVFLHLAKECGFPIAAPSANSFGKPSPTSSRDVFEDMDGKIPLIISAGACSFGIESTIVGFFGRKTSEKQERTELTRPMLLRPGGISLEQLEETVGPIDIHPTITSPVNGPISTITPESPGMKYKHYSPQAEIIVIKQIENTWPLLQDTAAESFNNNSNKKNILLITPKLIPVSPEITKGINLEQVIITDEHELAQRLFALFRAADRQGVDTILVVGVPEKGIGLGIMNRLKKASQKII